MVRHIGGIVSIVRSSVEPGFVPSNLRLSGYEFTSAAREKVALRLALEKPAVFLSPNIQLVSLI